MASLVLCLLLLVTPAVLSRHVPRFSDLDEDEQHLYRAAYDTPSYDHDEYEQEEELDLHLGKLDLVKDGLWALKAKIKEMKAFQKALAANMLSTKLKLKDLLKNHLAPIKTHHHEKPSYSYHAPSYQVPQYAPPQYPEPQHAPPRPQYPQPQAPELYPAAQYPPQPPMPHDPYYGL